MTLFFDIELVIRKKGDIFVDIPAEHSADFIEYMAENEIKVKEELKAEGTDEVVDLKTAEKSMDDANSTEKVMDDAKGTEKVCDTDTKGVAANSSVKLKTEVDKIIAEAQISWLKPELASVDTVKAE